MIFLKLPKKKILDSRNTINITQKPILLFPKLVPNPQFNIYDGSLYNGESHMLFIRLYLTSKYVSKFAFVVSNSSFQGSIKTRDIFDFSPFKGEILHFMDRISFYYVSPKQIENSQTSWNREFSLRNLIYSAIRSFSPKSNDLIYVSDCDEILYPFALDYIIKNPPKTIYNFLGDYFWFNFQTESSTVWPHPFIIRFGKISKKFQTYRFSHQNQITEKHFFFHCSYCFPSLLDFIYKFKTFSHVEYAKEPYINPSFILAKIISRHSFFSTENLFYNSVNYLKSILPSDDERLKYLFGDLSALKDIEIASEAQVQKFLNMTSITSNQIPDFIEKKLQP